MVPLSFAGASFAALSPAALVWPARRALLVADLHLEKASFYAAGGQMLPPYDSMATLRALATLVERTGAEEIWCLGDSFHDAAGCERLAAGERALLRGLTGATRWTWIAGNHDAGAARLAELCGGRVLSEIEIDGIVLRHEADPAEPRPELSGHFHPKLRLTVKGRHVARPCFVASATKLILPAFGAFTGGLDVGDRAIRAAIGVAAAQALVPLADRLLRFPIAA